MNRFGEFPQNRRAEIKRNIREYFIRRAWQRFVQKIFFDDFDVRKFSHVLTKFLYDSRVIFITDDMRAPRREHCGYHAAASTDIKDDVGLFDVRMTHERFDDSGAAEEILCLFGDSLHSLIIMVNMNYVALLRGINVGGNNKVAMSDLRDCFEKQGFNDVSTYINSGNVLFSSDEKDVVLLVKKCEDATMKSFGFPVVTMILSANDLASAIGSAPAWWNGDPKEVRNEALFVIPPTTAEEVLREIQKKTPNVDKFAISGQVIFWTLPRESYTKSVVPKIIGTPIYRRVTIRSATTARKLLGMIDKKMV
jgi:uncharacterized protein (DUF1697 family)